MSYRRALSVCGVFVALCQMGAVSVGCGAGKAGDALRPKAATAWDVTGEEDGQCRAVADRGEPLIVDWPAHERGDMEEAMNDGVAVVAYDCHSLRLLRGCRLDSTYGFMAFSKKEQTIRFENADEVAANLPAFGIPLLQGIHGDLKSDSTLDLAMILVGKKRTTLREAKRENLTGGAACDGATHFVRGAFVGAFAMGTGTRGQASLGAGLFAAGSNSSQLANYRDGEPASCQQVTTGTPAAPDTCDALLRLELVAFGKSAAKEDSTEPTCSGGLVLSEGKCVRPTADKPHQCKSGDLVDCTAQCEKGHAGSCSDLGVIYESGRGAPRDYAKAFALYKRGCDGGNAIGCSNLGFMYESGESVASDVVRAAALYKQSCDEGNAHGCANLGVMYETGKGVTRDFARAFALYKSACDGGDAQGCTNLGYAYDAGEGVTSDAARAVAFYKQGCDGGNAHGCSNLGFMYEVGKGVQRDLGKAFSLYKKACDAGDLRGCSNLGVMYENGKSVPQDYAQAATFYARGCEGGDAQGCSSLGYLYDMGQGVAQDSAKAVSLYTRGCDRGDAHGCSNLGFMYETGKGVTLDAVRAVALYKQGCDGGNAHGCSNLGVMYENGKGVPADRTTAIRLYRLSCQRNDSAGCANLQRTGEAP